MKSIDDCSKAFEVGIDAIAADELVYRPAKDQDDQEGLNYGPAARDDLTWREKLKQSIRPAFKQIVSLAKRVHQLKETLKNNVRDEIKEELRFEFEKLKKQKSLTNATATEAVELAKELGDKKALKALAGIKAWNRPPNTRPGLDL